MRRVALFFIVLFGFVSVPARAEIEVGFWTRELGLDLPHAFFTIRGAVEATGAVGLQLPNGKHMMKRPTSDMRAVAAGNRDFPSLQLAAAK